ELDVDSIFATARRGREIHTQAHGSGKANWPRRLGFGGSCIFCLAVAAGAEFSPIRLQIFLIWDAARLRCQEASEVPPRRRHRQYFGGSMRLLRRDSRLTKRERTNQIRFQRREQIGANIRCLHHSSPSAVSNRNRDCSTAAFAAFFLVRFEVALFLGAAF